jgi:hypothetical protein
MKSRDRSFALVTWLVIGIASGAAAQITTADYARAQGLREKYQLATVDVADGAAWVGTSNRLTYRKTVPGGHAFVLVDASSLQKQPAFDHAALAAAIGKITGATGAPTRVPFTTFRYTSDERAIEFSVGRARWRCVLADYACTREEPPAPGEVRRGITGPVRALDASAPIAPKQRPAGARPATPTSRTSTASTSTARA